ncbi:MULTISPECIES: YsnF/AvaK domain-containing protein [unclassified Sphingomonas]|uniref:YsnF/AvaK domain-containing protein n=1 Tax=unclassified Sphingomonas TaxID=196159 RepID=UPI00226994A0
MPEPDDLTQIIPTVEESVTVDKVVVQTDAVRVRTLVEETDVLVEDVVDREALKIKRVRLDQPVTVAPPPREEGDTTIISLIEERLVVEKRLFVVEEIHVTREKTQERVTIPVTLRAVRATVERPSEPSTTGNTTNG